MQNRQHDPTAGFVYKKPQKYASQTIDCKELAKMSQVKFDSNYYLLLIRSINFKIQSLLKD